ncbi:ABC transporter [Enterobacter cloacae]|uniref:ABC transporter n=1 Tax=Enterobacter cloacae TaxID=550 RepID=A0A144AAY3_ENTCL|nr:ABC transporter [Enterobacter cloacae]SAF49601.1 ABC transporter [Enterobacter cloacae]
MQYRFIIRNNICVFYNLIHLSDGSRRESTLRVQTLDTFIQQLINGVMLGSIYALIALGYTMVYGILRIINFAHGDILMVGALTTLSAINALNATFPHMPLLLQLGVALAIAMAVCALLAMAVERFAYRRLRNAPRLAPLISGIGVSVLLQTVAMIIWTRNPLMFPQILPMDPIAVTSGSELHPPAIVTVTGIVTVALALAVMTGLWLLVEYTRLGRGMRAVAENPRVATLMGVNPNAIIALTFAIGGVFAALAGVMMASNYGNASFSMGFLPGIKAFTAAVLGGIGNIRGAMIGGILLGIIEALGAGYLGELTHGVFGSNYQDVFAFMVLILVLVFRPAGLLGERVAHRA